MRGEVFRTSMGRMCAMAGHRFLLLVVTAALVSFGCSPSEEGAGGAGGAAGSGGAGGAAGSGGGGTGGSSLDCDPVAQTGCGVGDKCGQVLLVDDPLQLETRCVPDGTVPKGGACVFGPAGDQGFDDCTGGLNCLGGECVEICSSVPDSCPSTETCILYADQFADREGVGFCQFACDPLEQNCPDAAEACFLGLTDGAGICAAPFLDGGTGQQGEDCQYLNGCDKGYGCLLTNDPVTPTGFDCAFFCDSTGGSGPACSDGPGATFTCAELRTFYSDSDAPAGLGICVDCTVWADNPVCQ